MLLSHISRTWTMENPILGDSQKRYTTWFESVGGFLWVYKIIVALSFFLFWYTFHTRATGISVLSADLVFMRFFFKQSYRGNLKHWGTVFRSNQPGWMVIWNLWYTLVLFPIRRQPEQIFKVLERTRTHPW